VEEARAQDTGFQEGGRLAKHQAVPGLFLESLVAEVSILGRGVVLGFDILGMHF
jgi:hypothetical protein